MNTSQARGDLTVVLTRAYDARDTQPDDGTYRVLVDRLWPRGISKESLHLTAWNKDIAPSDELRKAFHADELSYESFASSYREELSGGTKVDDLVSDAREQGASTIELVFSAKDTKHNNASVLRDLIRKA